MRPGLSTDELTAKLIAEAALVELGNEVSMTAFLRRWSVRGRMYHAAAKMALICRFVVPNAAPDHQLTSAELDRLLALFTQPAMRH